MATKKTTTKSNKNFLARHKILTTFAVLVLLIAGWAVSNNLYQGYLDKKDKEKFEAVTHTVEMLHDRLNSKISNGSWSYKKYCSVAGTKSSNPPISCSATTRSTVLAANSNQAEQMALNAESILEGSNDLIKLSEEPLQPGFLSGNKNYGGSGYIDIQTNMTCSSFYELEDSNLTALFSCDDLARSTWYPELD